MTSAIIGILTTIIPMVLDMLCDRISKTEGPKIKGESDVRILQQSNDALSVATAFARHDDKLRKLLLKSKARKSRSK